jgi:hypothetical protein
MVFYIFNDRTGNVIRGRVACCAKRLDSATFNAWAKGIAEKCHVPEVAITGTTPMDGE